MDLFLRDLKQIGFSGVQNFPTVGLIDGSFRENLEETGMGYAEEVEMIARAHDQDLITCPYVFSEDDAKAMAKAGADLLIAHMGLTTKGTIGAKTALTLDQAVERIQAIREAAISIRPEILVLCHGGPIAEPEDVEYILSRTKGICGFFGASSIERLPTERAITEQVRNFKNLKIDKDHR
jgi:predicted TIM-barrel enzyme